MEWGLREWLGLAGESLLRGLLFTIFVSLVCGWNEPTKLFQFWLFMSMLVFLYIPVVAYVVGKMDEEFRSRYKS